MDLLTYLIVAIATLLATIYTYFYFGYKYWERRGFPYITPTFPLGNSPYLFRKTKFLALESMDYYDELKKRGLKFGGVFSILRPILIIRDPEYSKDILSKDFQYFVNRGAYYNEKDDPVSAHLFVLDGAGWRNMRAQLTPTFTSGKMKMMFPIFTKTAEDLTEAIGEFTRTNADVDIRELLVRYTIDVISSCAFGIEANCFKNPKSEMRDLGRKMFEVKDWMHGLALTISGNAPDLARTLGIKALRSDVAKFCTEVLEGTIKYRESNNIRRPDFLQLLIDMKNKDQSLTMPQLVAQVTVFFLAGFDTSTSTMNFTLYELSKNPDIQERLRKEINDVLGKHGGEISYDNIKEMTYLDQVVNEAHRKWHPVPNLFRECVKDYKLRDTNLIVEKGTQILIPQISIQRDPDNFPNPEKFDPERFSRENISSRHPYLHLPFGEGPRNCIGLRFGSMQSKVGIISVIKNFRVSVSPSTKMPLTINPRNFLLMSNETLYLKAEKI